MKGTINGNLAVPSAEECDSSNRLDRPDVVECQFNWGGPEEVIESYSVGNSSTSGLKQNMGMSNASV